MAVDDTFGSEGTRSEGTTNPSDEKSPAKAGSEKVQPPPQKPRRIGLWVLFVTLAVVLALCLLAVAVWFGASGYVQGKKDCPIADQRRCEKARATCEIREGVAKCKCTDPAHMFYADGSCDDRCVREAGTFCPDGVCVESACHDMKSLAGLFYDLACTPGEPVGRCKLSCNEMYAMTCKDSNKTVPFCGKSRPKELANFICQDGGPLGRFRHLSDDELPKCLNNSLCSKLRTIYPCFAGYVRNGSLVCRTECAPSKDHKSLTPFYGYCLPENVSGQCSDSMTDLEAVLGRHRIGYAFDNDSFLVRDDLPTRFFEWAKDADIIRYLLMMCYGYLSERHIVPYSMYTTNMSCRLFYEWSHFNEMIRFLRSLYPGVDVRRMLLSDKSKCHCMVGSYAFTHIATIEWVTKCQTLLNCPPMSFANLSTLIGQWTRYGGPHCTTFRLMYLSHRTIGAADWTRYAARMRDITLATDSITFLYPLSFLRSVIDHVSWNIGLFHRAFEQLSERLCNLNESNFVYKFDKRQLALPMTLHDRATTPDGLSGFALVLADDAEVRRQICPRVSEFTCEVRLYYAFEMFIPPPTQAESRLTGSSDRLLVYLILRAAMRRFQKIGVKCCPPEVCPGKVKNSSEEVRKSAARVAEYCFQRIV